MSVGKGSIQRATKALQEDKKAPAKKTAPAAADKKAPAKKPAVKKTAAPAVEKPAVKKTAEPAAKKPAAKKAENTGRRTAVSHIYSELPIHLL